jgi:hypothetical protein
MLGAVVGGLLENFSLLLGMRSLLLLTIAVYWVAAIALWNRLDAGSTADERQLIGERKISA